MGRRIYNPRLQHHVPDLADKTADVAEAPERAPPSPARHAEASAADVRSVYDQVARNRLLPTPEECDSLENAVAPAELMRTVEDLLTDEPGFATLVPDDEARHEVVRLFMALPLAPPLAYKLTVAREERPEILDHSLRVAYCAAALARHCRMAHHEIVNAAAAGLFHDIGLLHVDPELLHKSAPLREHERHYLYSHPLTAYLILEQSAIWHPIVSTAVLEHHERIDGSGYPRGLTGDKLGELGQLLAVAELGATLLSRGGGYASRDRLGIVLRMNEGKLNRDFCNALLSMLPPGSAAELPHHRLGEVLEILVELAIAFLRWQEIQKLQPKAPLAGLIGKRMERLARNLASAGIDLEYWTAIDADVEFDTRSLGEMEVAAREGVWQLYAIANETCRRWEQFAGGSEPIAAAVVDWIDSVEEIRAE